MSKFILAREGKHELPGTPIAIVRSQDPALHDLFLCVVAKFGDDEKDETAAAVAGKRKRTKTKADVEEALGKQTLAELAAAQFRDELGEDEVPRHKYKRHHRKGDPDSDSDSDSDSDKEEEHPKSHVQTQKGGAASSSSSSKPAPPHSDKADFVRLPLGSFFEPLPEMQTSEDGKRFQFTGYIAGKGGSGKSRYMAGIIRRFHSINPSLPVYGVCKTKLKDDPAYADLPIQQIPIASFKSEGKQFDVKKWFGDTGCFVLFDDWDSLEPADKAPVQIAIKDVLNVGRKLGVSTGITSHLLTNYTETRGITNECNYITIFPQAVLYDQMYYMANKTGVPKDVIKRFKAKGRWVTIHTSEPTYVLSETEAEMI